MRSAGFVGQLAPVVAALALSLAGCEAQGPEGAASRPTTAVSTKIDASGSLAPAEAADRSKAGDEATKDATAGRKIIYNAVVNLVTEDLNAFETGLTRLISDQKAYIADSDRSGSAGSSRHGSWKVRVPVGSYDAFVKGAVKLGELVSMKADSQDVSEEFFDLEARQKAKEVEEARLLKHLTESTGKLEEILTVERELSRVRGEIERMQGRLRALSNLTTLATVTIAANEIKDYVPPQAPTLGTRVGRTFFASVEALQQFGEGLLLFVVAIAPWLPIVLVGLWLVVLAYRRSSR